MIYIYIYKFSSCVIIKFYYILFSKMKHLVLLHVVFV